LVVGQVTDEDVVVAHLGVAAEAAGHLLGTADHRGRRVHSPVAASQDRPGHPAGVVGVAADVDVAPDHHLARRPVVGLAGLAVGGGQVGGLVVGGPGGGDPAVAEAGGPVKGRR